MSARSCQDVREHLSAYLDGELDAVPAGEIRGHLESCSACRAELELLRHTVGALRRLRDLPPPGAILAGVRARLRPEPWYRRLLDGRQWRLGIPVGALATVLVVVGIALFQERLPEVPRMVSQGPVPPSSAPSAPSAPELPSKPMPITRLSPVVLDKSADRQAAAQKKSAAAGADVREYDRAAPVPPVAPALLEDISNVGSKAEQSQPGRPEPAAGALENGGGETRTISSAAKMKEARTVPTKVEVVCLLHPDGDSLHDIEQFLRREVAGEVAIIVLEPRAVREAYAPYRERPGFPPEPSRGWVVTAQVPANARVRLLDHLSSRICLRILEQPAAPEVPEGSTSPFALRVTVLR